MSHSGGKGNRCLRHVVCRCYMRRIPARAAGSLHKLILKIAPIWQAEWSMKMTKANLVAAVAQNADITKKDGEKVVNAVLDAITEALANGEKCSWLDLVPLR